MMKEYLYVADIFMAIALFCIILFGIRFVYGGMVEYPSLAISIGSILAFISFYELRMQVKVEQRGYVMFWNIRRMMIVTISMMVIGNLYFIYVCEITNNNWLPIILIEFVVMGISSIFGYKYAKKHYT